MAFRCINPVCRRLVSNGFQCLKCGTQGPVEVEDDEDDDESYSVATLDKAKELSTMELPGVCLAPGGRIVTRGVLLVGGMPGAGKSTEAAALGLALGRAAKWKAPWNSIQWIDAEQSAPEVRACFDRNDATRAERRRVRRYRCGTLNALLEALADGSEAYCVVDSLHVLSDNDAEIRELVDACIERGKRSLLVAIAHANKKGDPRGTTYAAHKMRATFWVEHARVVVRKCRWSPIKEIKRGSVVLEHPAKQTRRPGPGLHRAK